ncbi:MAG: ABC transporter ATP-binding protein [Myxococcota bacterium]
MIPERPATTLACEGVGHRYGEVPVLDGIDLRLEPGTVTTLLGPNGAGKSTLLRILAGVLRPTAGRVHVGDRELRTLDRRAASRALALVGTEPEVPFAWTSLEIVLMGRAPHLAPHRLERPDDHARAEDALARVGADHLAGRPLPELSAGERQRVLLARALCQDTPALLLDEPTSHQDPAHALRLADLMRDLARDGRTVVAVLHDLNLAARAGDRMVFLHDRRIAADGPPDEVLTPDVIRRVYGVGCRRVEGEHPAVVLGMS